MGRQLAQSVQELFDDCRRGHTEQVQLWLTQKGKKHKSPLNFLRHNGGCTPSSGWLSGLREPATSHTLLHLAALNGHTELAQLLVQRDAQLATARDRKGCLPLHLAAWNGHEKVIEALLDAEPPIVNALDNAKESALHLATLNGHAHSVRLLLKRHADGRLRNARLETPLDIAVRSGKANLCRLLLMHSPGLALQSASDCCASTPCANKPPSPLHPLHSAAQLGHEECVEALLEHGFDVNYLGAEGTALHAAVRHAQSRTVHALLAKGIDTNIRDSEGRTALEWLLQRLAKSVTVDEQSNVEGWRQCCAELERHSSELQNAERQQKNNANKENTWKSVAPKNRQNGIGKIPPTPPEHGMPPVASPRSLSLCSSPSVAKGTPPTANGSSSSTLSSPSPGSVAARFCVYQPLPEAILTGNAREQSSSSTPVPPQSSNYENVPKQRQAYDNAPAPDQQLRRWTHNCCEANGVANGCTLMGKDKYNNGLLQECESDIAAGAVEQKPADMGNALCGAESCSPKKNCAKWSIDELGLLRLPTEDCLGAESDAFVSPCSTLERTISPQSTSRRRRGKGDAPLAIQEDVLTSACATLERNISPTLPSKMAMREQTSPNVDADDEEEEENNGGAISSLALPSCNSISTLAASSSSCSLPLVSAFSPTPSATTPISPERHLTPPTKEPPPLQPQNNKPCSLSPPQLRQSETTTAEGEEEERSFSRARVRQLIERMECVHSARERRKASAQEPPMAEKQDKVQHMSSLLDHDAQWKEIDEMLSAIQRESSTITQNGHNIKDGAQTTSYTHIVRWLHNGVGLDRDTAAQIGHLLHSNGFDSIQFMKGSVNTALMAELGIERVAQLRICRHLNEKALLEAIPSASRFDFVSDWLATLQLLDYLGSFAHANLTSTRDAVAANLARGDLEKMGITPLGHIARLLRSLEMANKQQLHRRPSKMRSHSPIANGVTPPQRHERASSDNGRSLASSKGSAGGDSSCCSRGATLSPALDLGDLRARLMDASGAHFSAHYLGCAEISNVEGTHDCRRAMHAAKARLGQRAQVPQVVLEVNVHGVNILDTNNKPIHRQPIGHIQVVCQDELDLNCFAYIFQDGERHFCHVFCVLTAVIAKEIIVTLGEAFNLAYKLALQQKVL